MSDSRYISARATVVGVLLHNASAEQVFAEPFEPFDIENFVRPRWHRQASCRSHPSLSWFPEGDDEIEVQQAICAGCPVADECAEVGADATDGIWAAIEHLPETIADDRRQDRLDIRAMRAANPMMPRSAIAACLGLTNREVSDALRRPRARWRPAA
jgi:hypothetical protein